MAAIFMAEKSFTPYKQLKSIPKRNNGTNFISKPNENLAPTNPFNGGAGGGLFFAPPQSLSFSYPPPPSHLNPIFYPNHRQMRQQQPPLLPLPTHNKPLHNSLPSRTQSLSSSPSNRKNNRTRDQSLTPKRSKSRQVITCEVLEDQPKKDNLKSSEATIQADISKSSVKPLGPDPNDLPKILGSSYIATGTEKFSGSVFTLSPPPSSLPLPKFSLKPKLISCNVEAAAGVDVGATDNLRRLLRLR